MQMQIDISDNTYAFRSEKQVHIVLDGVELADTFNRVRAHPETKTCWLDSREADCEVLDVLFRGRPLSLVKLDDRRVSLSVFVDCTHPDPFDALDGTAPLPEELSLDDILAVKVIVRDVMSMLTIH